MKSKTVDRSQKTKLNRIKLSLVKKVKKKKIPKYVKRNINQIFQFFKKATKFGGVCASVIKVPLPG